MSNSKAQKNTVREKLWIQCFDIIYKKFCSTANSKGLKANFSGFCSFLDISAGKRQKWAGGQWPSAEDLLTIHEKLGFSFTWLVTGEGEPFEEGSDKDEATALKAENAKLREELAQADRLNRQLTARLLCDAGADVVTRKASGQE